MKRGGFLNRKTALRAKPWGFKAKVPDFEQKKARKRRKLTNSRGIWTTKKADSEFSKWVRSRDVFCYFGCGRPSRQNSHFWGRANSGTRYDPLNCDGACGKCHMEHEGNKQGHYRDLKIKQLGKKRYDEMEQRARGYYSREQAIIECMDFLKLSPIKNFDDQETVIQY